MACQTRVRSEGKREHTKHMLRLRHAEQITGKEANEIILLNSHDGTSSYQMLAGMFRFVCQNGLVCGEISSDIRVRHNGNVVGEVIEGAFKVLDSFEQITQQREAMQGVTLNPGEQSAFAHAALSLKYDEGEGAAPVTEAQILTPRRFEDRRDDMWGTFNRVQENLLKGGLRGRSKIGRSTTTRQVNGIDQSVKLNRALWILAEEHAAAQDAVCAIEPVDGAPPIAGGAGISAPENRAQAAKAAQTARKGWRTMRRPEQNGGNCTI